MQFGGIGDYIKYFMITLTECMDNNTKFYYKINNIEFEKYIKPKYDILNIRENEISKLTNVSMKEPCNYFGDKTHYNYKVNIDEVFIFDDIVKENVKNLLPSIPSNYISIHVRLGDKYLETDKKFICCVNDSRCYSDEKIYNFINVNSNNNIILFSDNHSYKVKLKDMYNNIIITNAQIGHTSLLNTTSKQILDAVTEFYILSNSKLIYGASYSGFSKVASMFKNVEYLT